MGGFGRGAGRQNSRATRAVLGPSNIIENNNNDNFRENPYPNPHSPYQKVNNRGSNYLNNLIWGGEIVENLFGVWGGAEVKSTEIVELAIVKFTSGLPTEYVDDVELVRYNVRLGDSDDSSADGQIIEGANTIIYLRSQANNAIYTQREILARSGIQGVTVAQLLAPNAYLEDDAVQIYRNRPENRGTILRQRYEKFGRMSYERYCERSILLG